MPRCSCVFCSTPASTQLPVPVLVVRTSDQLSFWVWVTNVNSLEVHVSGHYKPFNSFIDAATFFAWPRIMGIHDSSDIKILVRTLGGAAQWQMVRQNFVSAQGRSLPPTVRDPHRSSCICIQLATPPMRTAMTAHGAAFTPDVVLSTPQLSSSQLAHHVASQAYEASERESERSASAKASKKARKCVGRSSARVPSHITTAPNADVQREPGEGIESRRRQNEKNASGLKEMSFGLGAGVADERRPQEECGSNVLPQLAYDLAQLGGDDVEVRRIVQCRNKWDAEVVEELIRWGARPRLFKVHALYEGGAYVKAQCTFVQLDGRLVRDVWMPLEYLRMEYADHVRHLK